MEEIIQRDINRTFPEHPQFSFEQGQQELFRVLKAYSLHDLQVQQAGTDDGCSAHKLVPEKDGSLWGQGIA